MRTALPHPSQCTGAVAYMTINSWDHWIAAYPARDHVALDLAHDWGGQLLVQS